MRRLAVKLLERAGRPVRVGTPPGYADERIAGTGQPDPARQRGLLTADVGGVLEDLTPLWPDLPERLAHRLHALFTADAHRERARARYELAYGRDRDAYPPTPTLYWQVELFQVALHEALCGLAERLWATGRWEAGLEDALLRRVLPNVRLHLGWAASRTARPRWPSPETATEGVGDLPMLGDDDPLYGGWARLALVERLYRPNPSRPYRRPVEEITVFSGAVAVPFGLTIPSGVLPFTDGDVHDWWSPDPPPAIFPAQLAMGPVARLTRASDWLGRALVLIPPIALDGCLQLEPARHGEPLVWRDALGDPAVVLRTWWVRNSEFVSAEAAACEGADLVIRPDLFERLSGRFGVPLRELRVVWRHPIGQGAEGADED